MGFALKLETRVPCSLMVTGCHPETFVWRVPTTFDFPTMVIESATYRKSCRLQHPVNRNTFCPGSASFPSYFGSEENETRSSGRWQALATLATQGAEAPSLALKELPLQGATHLLALWQLTHRGRIPVGPTSFRAFRSCSLTPKWLA